MTRRVVGSTNQPEYVREDAGDYALPHWVVSVERIVAEAIGDGAGDGNYNGNEV